MIEATLCMSQRYLKSDEKKTKNKGLINNIQY